MNSQHVGWLLMLLVFACAGPALGQARSEGPKPAPRPAPSPAKPPEPELVVRSKALAERLRPSSSGSRYDPNPTDWSQVPPWRQTSFFGIRAEGRFFIYVVDCSGSMIDDDRLIRAKTRAAPEHLALQPPQRFKVIFYNDQAIPMPGDLPRSADLPAKNQLNQWLRLIEPDGETDPRPALSLALGAPSRCHLPALRRRVSRRDRRGDRAEEPRKVPIHCIDLAGGDRRRPAQRIAQESGGRYASRPFSGFVAN